MSRTRGRTLSVDNITAVIAVIAVALVVVALAVAVVVTLAQPSPFVREYPPMLQDANGSAVPVR